MVREQADAVRIIITSCSNPLLSNHNIIERVAEDLLKSEVNACKVGVLTKSRIHMGMHLDFVNNLSFCSILLVWSILLIQH